MFDLYQLVSVIKRNFQVSAKFCLIAYLVAFSIVIYRIVNSLVSVALDLLSSIFSAKVALKNRSTIFTLGNRGSVLTTELEEPVIVPYAALKSEKKVIAFCFYVYF